MLLIKLYLGYLFKQMFIPIECTPVALVTIKIDLNYSLTMVTSGNWLTIQ